MTYKGRLPLLLSVPHGGLEIPPEVRSGCRLGLPALLRDGDTWSGHLYSLEERVSAFFRFPVARAVLDLNRAAEDRPPENPDGVVKTVTVCNEQVWENPEGLSDDQITLLLDRYYHPYHRGLLAASKNGNIKLGLDCHTMLARAPQSSDHPGETRPLVCLSNRGDQNGEALDEPLTAPPGMIRALGRFLEQQLTRLDRNRAVPVVRLNRPFNGGYITTKHGRAGHIPWIQVELNRSLYLSSEPLAAVPDQAANARIKSLQRCLFEAFKMISLY